MIVPIPSCLHIQVRCRFESGNASRFGCLLGREPLSSRTLLVTSTTLEVNADFHVNLLPQAGYGYLPPPPTSRHSTTSPPSPPLRTTLYQHKHNKVSRRPQMTGRNTTSASKMAPSTKRKFPDHTDSLSTSRHKIQRSTSILETPPPTGHRARKAAPTPSKAFKPRAKLPPTPLKATKPTTLKLRAQPTSKSSRKTRIAADPINISIYELRKQGKSHIPPHLPQSREASSSTPRTDTLTGLDWTDIAIRANEECKLDSEHELSGPACYSRFKRNGPLVAEARGEPYQKEW